MQCEVVSRRPRALSRWLSLPDLSEEVMPCTAAKRDPESLWQMVACECVATQCQALDALGRMDEVEGSTIFPIVMEFMGSRDERKERTAIMAALRKGIFEWELLQLVVEAMSTDDGELMTVCLVYLSENMGQWYGSSEELNEVIRFHLCRVLETFAFESSSMAAQLLSHMILRMNPTPEIIRDIARFFDDSLIGQIIFLELASLLAVSEEPAICETVWDIFRERVDEGIIQQIIESSEISDVGAQTASLILQACRLTHHQMWELTQNEAFD